MNQNQAPIVFQYGVGNVNSDLKGNLAKSESFASMISKYQ